MPTPTQVTLESSPESAGGHGGAGGHEGAGVSAMAACAWRSPRSTLSRRRN